eukprot:g82708.t1
MSHKGTIFTARPGRFKTMGLCRTEVQTAGLTFQLLRQAGVTPKKMKKLSVRGRGRSPDHSFNRLDYLDDTHFRQEACEAPVAPVVLIHGMFGWGYERPAGGLCPSYWPGVVKDWQGGFFEIGVGASASDHDRAVEGFYQLYGGQLDFGQEHSEKAGHERFGPRIVKGLFPEWSAERPVHLIGHSYGGTTAIALYQLLAKDFFKVGSDHRWVKSISTIASPLCGATLPYVLGVRKVDVPKWTAAHIAGSAIGTAYWLTTCFPRLKSMMYDFRISQYDSVTCLRNVWNMEHPWMKYHDNIFQELLPSMRIRRNCDLVDMDKVYLFSFVTSMDKPSRSRTPLVSMVWQLVLWSLILLQIRRAIKFSLPLLQSHFSSASSSPIVRILQPAVQLIWLNVYLALRKGRRILSPRWALFWLLWWICLVRGWRSLYRGPPPIMSWFATLNSVPTLLLFRLLSYLMKNHHFPSALYPGFNPKEWMENDGVVNSFAQVAPRYLKCSRHSSTQMAAFPHSSSEKLSSPAVAPSPSSRPLHKKRNKRKKRTPNSDAAKADCADQSAEASSTYPRSHPPLCSQHHHLSSPSLSSLPSLSPAKSASAELVPFTRSHSTNDFTVTLHPFNSSLPVMSATEDSPEIEISPCGTDSNAKISAIAPAVSSDGMMSCQCLEGNVLPEVCAAGCCRLVCPPVRALDPLLRSLKGAGWLVPARGIWYTKQVACNHWAGTRFGYEQVSIFDRLFTVLRYLKLQAASCKPSIITNFDLKSFASETSGSCGLHRKPWPEENAYIDEAAEKFADIVHYYQRNIVKCDVNMFLVILYTRFRSLSNSSAIWKDRLDKYTKTMAKIGKRKKHIGSLSAAEVKKGKQDKKQKQENKAASKEPPAKKAASKEPPAKKAASKLSQANPTESCQQAAPTEDL